MLAIVYCPPPPPSPSLLPYSTCTCTSVLVPPCPVLLRFQVHLQLSMASRGQEGLLLVHVWAVEAFEKKQKNKKNIGLVFVLHLGTKQAKVASPEGPHSDIINQHISNTGI